MDDFTPEDITESTNPLGTYIADLERPGGILDSHQMRIAMAIDGMVLSNDDRAALLKDIKRYAELREQEGAMESDIEWQAALDEALGAGDEVDEYATTEAHVWEQRALAERLFARVLEKVQAGTDNESTQTNAMSAVWDYGVAAGNYGNNISSLTWTKALGRARDEN